MCKESLDMYDDRPREMKAYLKNYGWHFNKKMCEFAISLMWKKSPLTGKREHIELVGKDKIDELMKKHGVTIENNSLYDYVFVYHMAITDFSKSLSDEKNKVTFVKEYIEDDDAPDGTPMRRWYATMVAAGEPIEWDEML